MSIQVSRIHPRQKGSFFGFSSANTILILINLVVFFILLFFPQEFILKNIAISLENIQELRIWTFLTSMFMHGGWFHLFANMLSLLFIGGLVEKILGSKRYLWFYLISGLFAGFLYIAVEFLFSSNLPAVGASGAIFGLIGFLMLITPNLPVYVMLIPIPIKMKYAAPGILLVLWLISIAGNIPIGNTAHVGGLVVGLIYSIYLKNKYPNKLKNISRIFS